MKVELTGRARRDLRALIQYQRMERGEAGIAALETKFYTSFDELRALPQAVHRRPDLTTDDLFFYRCSPYMLILRKTKTALRIIRIAHESSNFSAFL